MFVVTSAGVIATDPIGYGRPEAVVTYVDEIKKVAGGQPIEQERLMQVKDPHTVLADETMDASRTLPKQKVLFAVDFVSVGSFPGRG
jgi:hypothetical protein